MPPVVSPGAPDQVIAEAPDLELRRRLEEEAEHWRSGARRDAAISGAVIALPVIAGLIWAMLAWWGVRQVEAEMKFVFIPDGCFDMGSSDSEAGRRSDEGPVHKVCIEEFYLGQYKVTRGEWRRVMVFINPYPSYFKGNDRLPVERVTWDAAQSFMLVMSFFGHGHYRLPSESEWEYAARAGTTTSRYWGDSIDDGCAYENIADLSLTKAETGNAVANCNDGYANTAPVGSFKANPWQLYDMLGNAADWVEDCYADNYRDAPTDGSPNTKEPCKARVVRGGSWKSLVRAASRGSRAPDGWSYDLGFRVARTITR